MVHSRLIDVRLMRVCQLDVDSLGQFGKTTVPDDSHKPANRSITKAFSPESASPEGATGDVTLSVYRAKNRSIEGISLLEQALQLSRQSRGPQHLETLAIANKLAAAYNDAGRWNDALPLNEEVLRHRREILGLEHRETLNAIANLATTYCNARRFNEAQDVYEGLLPLLRSKLGAADRDTLTTMSNLAALYQNQSRYADAAALAKERLESVRVVSAKESPELTAALAQTGLTLLQTQAWSEAEAVLRECLALREKQAPDDWRTFSTRSMLGGALLGQARQVQATDAAAAAAKSGEAEPFLIQGYEGMQQREATIPAVGKIRLSEALQRLVDLYTALGKPDEAAKWQEKLGALKVDSQNSK